MKTRHLFSLTLFVAAYACHGTPARVTVCIIIDQLSQATLRTHQPYFRYALKKLVDNGAMHTQCYQPLAAPRTAPGHATIATGTTPRYHGITDNSWFDAQGHTVACDTSTTSYVFTPQGELTSDTKGPSQLQLDTVCDQLNLHGGTSATSITVAGKSRSAIMFAGRSGSAYWMHDAGTFTSSRAYMQALPDWLQRYNQQHAIAPGTRISWHPMYDPASHAYRQSMPHHPGTPDKPKCNTSITLSERNISDYIATPHAQRDIITCARSALEHALYDGFRNILLCVSLSPLDYVGHYYGPESQSYSDMLYHADHDLAELIDWIEQSVPPEMTQVVLTSDHGSMPIPEQVHQAGMEWAQRVNAESLIQYLNRAVSQRFNVHNLIVSHSQPFFYLDRVQLHRLDPNTQTHIKEFLTHLLREHPAIIDAYTWGELSQLQTPDMFAPLRLLQNHHAPGRVGDISYLVRPYCNITNYPHGTTHATPYRCDTHVPLIMYQPDSHVQRTVTEPVSTESIAPYIATVCNIPPPSAAYQLKLATR